MAHQTLSMATIDEYNIDASPRRVSDSVYSIKRNHHHHNNNSGTCCSGGGLHGCGCGCKGCVCRLTHFKDESTRQVYGCEGGRGMVRPDIGLSPDRAQRSDSSLSSVRTIDSMSNGSFDNSFEVPGHLFGHHIASANIYGAGQQFEASEEEDDGHNAHREFLSPTNSHIPAFGEEDSSGMVIPGDLDDSMIVGRGSGISIDERSMLSSEYEPSFVRSSATASQILPGVGAAFEHHGHHFLVRPLRLSPECRGHTIITPICARCAH